VRSPPGATVRVTRLIGATASVTQPPGSGVLGSTGTVVSLHIGSVWGILCAA
jgi:hypothetical protein